MAARRRYRCSAIGSPSFRIIFLGTIVILASSILQTVAHSPLFRSRRADRPVVAKEDMLSLGKDAVVEVGAGHPVPEMHALTACTWIKYDGVNQPYYYLMRYTLPDGSEVSVTPTPYFTVGLALNFIDQSVQTFRRVYASLGGWHHACAEWSSVGGEWKIYFDGNVAGAGSDLKTGQVIPAGGTFAVAQSSDATNSYKIFEGRVFGFNLWSGSLGSAKIRELAGNCPSQPEGDIFAWSSGDLNINGEAEVTLSDVPHGTTNCDFGSEEKSITRYDMLTLNKDSLVSVGENHPIVEMQEFSAALWVRCTGDVTQDTLFYFFRYNDTAAGTRALLRLHQEKGFVYFFDTVNTGSIAVSDSLWHHVCITWTSNSGSWKLYVDGLLAGSGDGVGVGETVPAGGVLRLGQSTNSLAWYPRQPFGGTLTGFNLWSRVLGDGEVAQLAANCPGEQEGDVFAWGSGDLEVDWTVQVSPSDAPCGSTCHPNSICVGDDLFQIVDSEQQLWDSAREYCTEAYASTGLTSHLAVLADASVRSSLISHLRNEPTLVHPKRRAYWVGCDDQAEEGHFVWASGESVDMSSANWKKNEPNNKLKDTCKAPGNDQDCCQLWDNDPDGDNPLFQMDDNCCVRAKPFICQVVGYCKNRQCPENSGV